MELAPEDPMNRAQANPINQKGKLPTSVNFSKKATILKNHENHSTDTPEENQIKKITTKIKKIRKKKKIKN